MLAAVFDLQSVFETKRIVGLAAPSARSVSRGPSIVEIARFSHPVVTLMIVRPNVAVRGRHHACHHALPLLPSSNCSACITRRQQQMHINPKRTRLSRMSNMYSCIWSVDETLAPAFARIQHTIRQRHVRRKCRGIVQQLQREQLFRNRFLAQQLPNWTD